MTLAVDDLHCWGPAADVLRWLTRTIPKKARVLEIGPGKVPFARADTFIDQEPKDELNIVVCNVLTDDLPVADKEFDFVYCRHLIEDLWNPFRLLDEMSRVGKAGYVETPSPIAELCRGVDGALEGLTPQYSGYHHHCQIVWVDGNKLKIIHKYPFLEAWPTKNLDQWLRGGSLYWNSYYLWQDRIDYHHLLPSTDFTVHGSYFDILVDAICQSLKSSDEFYNKITVEKRKSA